MKQIITFLMLMLALTLAPMSAVADYHDTNIEDAQGRLGFGRYFWQKSEGVPHSGYEDHYYLVSVPEKDGTQKDSKKEGANALTSWKMEDGQPLQLETFLHMPAGRASLQLAVTTSGNVQLQFIFKTADETQTLATIDKTVSTNSQEQLVDVLTNVTLPASAYYRMRIKVISGAENIKKITYWKFDTESTELSYSPDYLSSPSVHTNEWKTTNADAPAGNSYDWAYEEVMIPESSNYNGTYCMSLGVFHGYMGIQVNGNRHDIIFSMWDNGNTDNDRNLPDYLRSGSLDANGGVAISRFGGEGTGTKAYRAGDYWVPGQWVKFLCNARPEQVVVQTADGPIVYNNTIVTAWYKTEGGTDNEKNAENGEDQYDGWHYIASHRLSGGNTYMNGWYSFLENFDWHSGNVMRKAYYRNGALHSLGSGKWSHRNVVSCSHTDGGDAPGKRNDYGSGIEIMEDGIPAFYMTTGGLADTPFNYNQQMPYIDNIDPVSQETMDKLLGRVQKAIQNEQKRNTEATMESETRVAYATQDYWVIAANSEATNEDKTADGITTSNRKEAAADGNENSYWHTNYGTGNGKTQNQFPYTLDLELASNVQNQGVGMIELYCSRDKNYRPKTVQVQYADNANGTWIDAGTYSLNDANRNIIVLNNEIKAHRYIRINITAGYGSHIVLNEVYLKSGYQKELVNEQVDAILAKTNRFDGYPESELAALRAAYKEGNWTDYDALKQEMVNLAATGHLIKFGAISEVNSVSSFKAYVLHNIYNIGDAVVENGSLTRKDCNNVDVLSQDNNWLLLRSEKWGAHFLYNMAAGKYLSIKNNAISLVEAPTPIFLSTVTKKNAENKDVFDGVCFRGDVNNTNGFLTVAANGTFSLGANSAQGARWEVRDNYGVTPDIDKVNQLLVEIDDAAQLVNLNAEAAAIISAPVGVVGGAKTDATKTALTTAYNNGNASNPDELRAAIADARLAFDTNTCYRIKSCNGWNDGYMTAENTEVFAPYHRNLDTNKTSQIWSFFTPAESDKLYLTTQGAYMSWIDGKPRFTNDVSAAKGITLVDRSEGRFNIQVESGSCIDVNAQPLTNWSDGGNSRWYLQPVESFTLTIPSSGVVGYCLPFNVDLSAYVGGRASVQGKRLAAAVAPTVSTITGVTNNVATYEELDLNAIIPAGTPFVLTGNAGTYTAAITAAAPATNDGALRGNYFSSTVEASSTYTPALNSGNIEYDLNTSTTLPANSVYIPKQTGVADANVITVSAPAPPASVEITYDIQYNGHTYMTEKHTVTVGEEYPEITSTLPFRVEVVKPTGQVEQGVSTVNVPATLASNYPFVPVDTYNATGTFYKLAVNAKKQYCYADGTNFNNGNYADGNDAYLWQFVGNPFTGYQFVNKKTGSKLYAPNSNTNPTISTSETVYWDPIEAPNDATGFYISRHGEHEKWINRNGGNGVFAFTNQWKDAGSTFHAFTIEQATVHFQNLSTKKWVSYNANAHASNVYNDVVILAQHEANEAQATEFTLTGSSAEGYKISCDANGTTKYVYAINKDNKDSNVGFTDDASAATLWKIQQTYRDANGIDYFNIIPTGGDLGWNARGKVNGVATVGQWNAGTATGGNNGSLWRIVSTQTEDITVTYHVTYGGVEKQTINQQTKKGSFYPSISGVPYGLNYTVPSGIVSADAEVTVGTTLASNYPVAPAATVGELTDANYFVMDINSDSHAYIHADGNSVQAHSETPSTVADIVKYQWAFVGNPFDGYSIYNKVGGTSKTLGASYALENGNAAKWKIVSGTASSFRVSPASSSGTYVSLSGNALANSTTTNNATNLRAVQATTWEQNFTKEYRIAGVTERPADLFSDMTLWYKTSAISTGVDNVWMEYSLPIGNGLFGASLYGNVKKDMVTFVDKTLWKKPANNYGSYQYFGELYAESLEEESLMGYNDETAIRNYVRYLDLDAGKAGVSYEDKNGGKYTHEYFASNPDNAIAIRYTASNGATINRRFTLVSGQPGGVVSNTTYAENGGYFGGKMEIESFNARFKVVNTGSTGTVTTTNEGIEVRGANEVLVILAGGTDYDITSTTYVSHTDQLPTTIANRVNDAAGKSWETLYTTHKTDYDKYYTACQFNIGGENTMDTESLVKNYNGDRAGASDLMLEQLYFAYGRYLSISSSRGADIPNNLQGIWANKQDLPWHSDIHTNINVQMNYWPVETTNLSDMHVPFLNQMIYETDTNIHNGWTQMAKNSNQQRGWTLFTESNIYGGSSGFQTNYVIANAWYVTHLWQHYRYTLDEEFLRKAFPAMLSCSQFWMDRLKLVNGKYLAPNEWSPEQGPNQDGVAHAQQLVRELFDNTIAAVGELDAVTKGLITAQDWEDLQERRQNLDLGLDIETYGGAWGAERNGVSTGANILREWKESPYTTGEAGHRHHSHLMCLYPFSQFTEGANGYTPEQLYEAALNSLKLRGDASTGWSMGWKMNLWARALDGDHTHVIIKNALRHSTSYGTDQGRGGIYYNLFDSHAPFQIDGNFGATAGMAECILQSHTGVINLLPALPAVWANGSMKGMKAVGNFTVDQEWADKQLTKATITSHKGQELIVKYKDVDLTTAKITKNGTEVTPVAVTGGYKIADVAANDVVIISFTDEPEEEEDVPEPSVTATYAPAVYPAQQEIVGEANLDVNVGSTKTTYTFSNEVLAAQFVKKNGTLKFNGSTAMNLKPGTELFTIKFGNGSTVVNASDMTLVGNVETGNLTANTDAVKGAEHFAGKYIQATFTHEYEGSNVTFVWKAELRDGSHYLRTDLTMTSDKDVQMNAIIPMQYDVDAAAAGSTPAVVGNTRGAVLMSDKIFAGLETPTAYNSVISNTTVPEKWSNYKAWTGESDFSWMPSELPSGITDLNSNYTPQTVVGSRGYLKFDTTGNQTITFTYTEGSHKLNIVGVDVLDTDGNIVAHDYHEGRTGTSHANNEYRVNIPSVGYYQVRYFISLLAWSESYKSESISSKGNITYSGSVSVPTVLFDLDPVAPASTRRKVLSADHIGNNENITDTWDTSTNQFQDMDDAKVPARIVELGHNATNICYREQNLNIASAGGTLTTTFTYKGGSNRLQIVGVDLVDAQGNVAVNDYHFGYTGNEKDANTYSFIVPAAGQYKLRYLVSKQGEALTSNGDIAINYEIIDYLHLPAPAEVSIQGLWSRQATLKASTGDNLTDKDVVWNVSSVVGLVNPDHKRRSFLAYSERERAVPWRPFPIYNSWYELNINRKDNETPTDNNMSAELCTNIVEAWKEKLYDQYNVGIKSFVWDDGWDQYGTWEHHANFPNGFMEAGQAAAAMNTGIGAWLGPVGGYGSSGTYRRNYWNAENRGGMALSNIKYYEVFKNAIVRLVETEPTRDHYDFNYFKFDGISGQFSSVGPDPGAKGNEDAEGIITCERYVRENVKEDVFFNTTVGTWASPFWFHFSDAIWRQENDYGTIGNNSSSRENWITYRDRLVYQNYIQRSPICPINTLMTHGFILHQRENGNFDGVSNDLNYQSVLNELRCAFACGSGMVELYADHRLMTSINGGKLWSDLTDCLKWQEANKDVLPDAHWVGGNPWTGSKAEIYGWAAWNGEKATLTLRNGAPSQQTFTTTLRDALDIPASFTGTIQLTAAFADQLGSLATIAGIAEGSDINPDTQITFTLPASSVYVYNGIDSEIAPEPVEGSPINVAVTFQNEGTTWDGVQYTVNATDINGNTVQNVTASASSSLSGANQGDGNPKALAEAVGTDKLGINYQTGGNNNQGAVLTLNFDLANLPAGSNFNCISLPMYAVAGGGGYQSDQAGTSEIDVTVTVKEGDNVLYTATKENFNITEQKNGNLNTGLVFNSDSPITIEGTSATVSFAISKGDTNGGCFMALQSLNLVNTRTITFVMGEPVNSTQTVKAPMGQAPVCPVSVPSYVTATYSPALATVTADATYNVSYAYNDGMPFTVGKTYNITLKNLTVSYNETENKFKDAAANLNDANSQFTIDGDWYHGFTLFNEGAGKYLTYGDNASPGDGTHAVTTETLNTGAYFDLAIKDDYNYFKLHGTTNDSYVNDRSGYFATWASTAAFGNDGSRLTFTEIEPSEVVATLTVNGVETNYYKNDAEIVLNDGQTGLTKVVIPNDVDNVNVTYTREFKNTNSQPWYVPFDITVPNGFTFYKIWTLKVDENTGVATAVVSKELSSGETIMANTPYIVKANTAGTCNFKSNALKATVEGEANDETWCATTELIYHFYGSYTSFDLFSKPCYYMSAGAFSYATKTATLKPYRFYLVVSDKETNTPISPADLESAGAGSKLQIITLGDEEDLPTGVGTVIAPSKNDIHFDIMGRKVNGNVSGLQILNGEKILVK